jgi:hypothetical protein
MLACFAFHAGDSALALETLRWIRDLGSCKSHDAALIVDADTPWDHVVEANTMVSECFRSCEIIATAEHVEGWIPGSDALWKEAALYAKAKGVPFWFHEPDCIPLKLGWLDALDDAYAQCHKPFMGALVEHTTPGLPNPYLEGNSVYPADAWDKLAPVWDTSKSWTLAGSAVVVPQAANTPLIHQMWGEVGNPPSFAENNIPHTNVFCPRQIRQEAVVWHRCKDGSLIRLLRRKMNLNPVPPKEIVTLFAFSMKDELCMLKALRLMVAMHGKLPRTCVLHFDNAVGRQNLKNIFFEASHAFQTVLNSQYPDPRRPNIGWPAAPSWAFLHACKFAFNNLKGPWLWFEGDAVALKPDWLYQIEAMYEGCGKPFMGPVIGSHHMNGTPSVYPWDTLERTPNGLSRNLEAFDTAIKDEMMHLCHDATDLVFHDVNQKMFQTIQEVEKTIQPGCAVYHPCKTGRLSEHWRRLKQL